MMGLGLRYTIARRAREAQVQRRVRTGWLVLAGVALMLVSSVAAAERAAWNGDRVVELATRLLDETQRLEEALRASVVAAEAATEDPDREPGVGGRTVVTQDVAVLQSRVKAYRASVEGGQGREETRSLFGRIESLVRLTGTDFRRMPDFAKYSAGLEALEKVVEQLGLFYAEELEVRTPPDPIERP